MKKIVSIALICFFIVFSAEAKTKKEESDGFQPAEKRKIPFDIPEELEQEMPFR